MLVAWIGEQAPPIPGFGDHPSRHLPESDFRASWLPDIRATGQEIVPGVWILDYDYERFEAKLIRVTAGSWTSGVDFTVRDLGYIEGMVVDENGLPWPHGWVRTANRQATIQKDGSFRILDLAAGTRYTVEVLPNEDVLALEEEFLLQDLRRSRTVEAPAEGIILQVNTVRAGEVLLTVTGSGGAPVTQYFARLSPIRVLQSKVAVNDDDAYSEKLARVDSEDGSHKFPKVFPGEYRLDIGIWPNPYMGQIVEYIVVSEGQAVSLEVSTEGRWAKIAGLVLDSSGAPVPNCEISLQNDWLKLSPDVLAFTRQVSGLPCVMGMPLHTETADNGLFSFQRVPLGKWVLSAEPSDSDLRAEVSLDVSGDRDDLRVVIPRGTGQIFGIITDRDGSPQRGRVFIFGDIVSGTLQAEPDGTYSFGDLAAAQYKLSCGWGPFVWKSRIVDLSPGGSVEVNFREEGTTGMLIADLDLTESVSEKLRPDEVACYPTLFLTDLERPESEMVAPLPYFRGMFARRWYKVPPGLYSVMVSLRLVPPGRPDHDPQPRPSHPNDVEEVISKPAVVEVRENSEVRVQFNQFE